MSLPQVAILGRPNVGKSSLLNRLAKRRVAIVEPTAGVTRDRVVVPLSWGERSFELIDTGGLGLVDEEQLKGHIEQQIQLALSQSDVVLFLVDGKEGLVPGDQLVADRLRRMGKPMILVVNKVESRADEFAVHDWLRLGFGEPQAVSALEGTGISDLLDRLVGLLPEPVGEEREDLGVLQFAVVGKRNSGKSTLINQLAGAERVIVSEIPGTTRDSVDVLIDFDGRKLLAIDTAGVRKKSSLADAIELFSFTRAKDSIRRADVVLHLFDVRETISQVDQKIAHLCRDRHKPVLLIGNKIDLADEIDLEKWDAYVRQQLSAERYAPLAFISAKDGTNVREVLDVMHELHDQAGTEISTSGLNEVLQEAKEKLRPKSRGRRPKLYYGTQVRTHPITILVFVNEPSLFRGQYSRYLENVLRERFDLQEVPIQLVFRQRPRGGVGSAAGES